MCRVAVRTLPLISEEKKVAVILQLYVKTVHAGIDADDMVMRPFQLK